MNFRSAAVGRGVQLRHEVVDLGGLGLAVAVDAADALFEPGRVERDVEVHQPVAVRLQVDALTGGVGGAASTRTGSLDGSAVNCERMYSRSSGGVEPWITASRSSA